MPASHDVVVFAAMRCLPSHNGLCHAMPGFNVPSDDQDRELRTAVEAGSIPCVRAVLEQGVDPNTTGIVSGILCMCLSLMVLCPNRHIIEFSSHLL